MFKDEDLWSLLHDSDSAEDKAIQTDISDEDLEKLLDRSDLTADNSNCLSSTLPLQGPGWEVVIPTASGNILSTLNS